MCRAGDATFHSFLAVRPLRPAGAQQPLSLNRNVKDTPQLSVAKALAGGKRTKSPRPRPSGQTCVAETTPGIDRRDAANHAPSDTYPAGSPGPHRRAQASLHLSCRHAHRHDNRSVAGRPGSREPRTARVPDPCTTVEQICPGGCTCSCLPALPPCRPLLFSGMNQAAGIPVTSAVPNRPDDGSEQSPHRPSQTVASSPGNAARKRISPWKSPAESTRYPFEPPRNCRRPRSRHMPLVLLC